MGRKTWRGEFATISLGNIKMGQMPSVSLPPVLACGRDIPCARDCYAQKAMRMYPTVRDCWQRNLTAAREHRAGYFADIGRFLAARATEYFRWHVAGDILDQEYLQNMVALANDFHRKRFLAFTKRLDLVYRAIPDNLAIVFSFWPGWGNPRRARRAGIPIAWMQDGTETRIPDDAIGCPGQCDTCGMCWQLPQLGRDVYMPKH